MLGMSRGSAVDRATAYGLDNQGVRVRVLVGSRIFTSLYYADQLWGPPNLLSDGYRRLFPQKVKHLGCEANNSPPTSN
jgi:hypothetical protein